MEVAQPLAPHTLLMNRSNTLDVSEALREKAKGNIAQYRFMVQDIASGARLIGWLSMLSQSVTDISDTHFELIGALLSFDWFSRLPAEVTAYTDFLVKLTYAKPHFFDKVYTSMVTCFRGPPQTTAASLEEKSDLTDMDREASFAAIHQTIKTLLEAHPTSISVLRNILCDKFPHKVFPTAVQASYVRQLLFLTSYVPALRKDALELITDKVVQIDVEMSSETRHRHPANMMDTSSEDVMFQMEAEPGKAQVEVDENEEKVDVMMSVFLKWLSAMSDLEADQMPLLEDVFKLLVGCFDRLLLTTNQTKYAQWALFYVCSMKEDFTMRLFEHLFDIVQNPKFPQQQRQRACMYIASLCSRAAYVKETMTQQVLEYMCSWMTKYIELQGDLGKPDLATHMLFYAMFHGVCYILRNVHESIFDVVSARHTIQALGILVIVRSGLNPLKICSPGLVAAFIGVMGKYGVSFTNVLQQNEKLVIPTKDVFGPSSALTDFFPFDPYILRRCSAFILPIYHYAERYHKFTKGDALESGYATEGETEMDMDLRGHHGGVDHPDGGDMDDEDAHTTESMMAMMDFGRGSIQLNANNGSKDGSSSQQNGLFGSFDEKSSLSSGGHGSHGTFQPASGSFSIQQPSFGNPFGGPLVSPATTTSSLGGFGSLGHSGFISQSPLRGPSPATDPGAFSLAGSLEPRRNTQAKRSRDENWMPSTPLSAIAFQPSTTSRPLGFQNASPSLVASSSHSWGNATVSSTSNPAEH